MQMNWCGTLAHCIAWRNWLCNVTKQCSIMHSNYIVTQLSAYKWLPPPLPWLYNKANWNGAGLQCDNTRNFSIYCVNLCMDVTNCTCPDMAACMNVCVCDVYHMCVHVCVFVWSQYVCVFPLHSAKALLMYCLISNKGRLLVCLFKLLLLFPEHFHSLQLFMDDCLMLLRHVQSFYIV